MPWETLSQKLQENNSVVSGVGETHQWLDYEEEGQ